MGTGQNDVVFPHRMHKVFFEPFENIQSRLLHHLMIKVSSVSQSFAVCAVVPQSAALTFVCRCLFDGSAKAGEELRPLLFISF